MVEITNNPDFDKVSGVVVLYGQRFYVTNRGGKRFLCRCPERHVPATQKQENEKTMFWAAIHIAHDLLPYLTKRGEKAARRKHMTRWNFAVKQIRECVFFDDEGDLCANPWRLRPWYYFGTSSAHLRHIFATYAKLLKDN